MARVRFHFDESTTILNTHTHTHLQTHTHNSNYTLLTTSIDDDFPIASAHAVRNSDYRFLFGRYVFKYCI